MLPYLGLVHAVVVAALSVLALRASELDWITKINVAVVAGWTNLVLTGLMLSTASLLDRPLLYCGLSVAIGALSMPLLARIGRRALPSPEPVSSIVDGRGVFTRGLLALLLVTGAVALLANVAIAVSYLPNNSDTVAYRLPRIYWYWNQGNLSHFASGVDPRVIYYPLNGVLLQLPIVQYQWSARLFTFTTLLAWCLVGATTFRIAREFGFSRVASIFSSWLVCLTPGVLVQAVSTNDDILAAFVLLIAVHFAVRFYRGRGLSDLSLALLAASLSVGTKLHAFFFWPVALATAAYAVVQIGSVARIISLARPLVLPVLPIALICLPLAAAFLWPNWRASGHLMEPDYSKHIVNKPFQFGAGLQNFVLHAAQTILSPVPDLNPISDDDARRAFYQRFNDAFSGLFAWVDQGPAYMSSHYRFFGASPSLAWFRNENSVDLGFSYLLLLGALIVCVRQTATFKIGLFFAGSFFIWFLTYSLTTKYIEGFSVYLAYTYIVCSACVVFSLSRTGGLRAVRVGFVVFVAATHLLGAVNILRFNVSRNLVVALSASSRPVNLPIIDESIISAIRSNGGARFLHTHWQIPYWAIMASYKEGRYSVASPHHPNPARLNILPFQKFTAYNFVPIRIPKKPSPGLTLLGSFRSDYGPEWAFAMGAGVDRDAVDRSGYIVLQLEDETNFGQATATSLKISPTVFGLNKGDGIQFRYKLQSKDGAQAISDWSSDPERRLQKPTDLQGATLTVQIRLAVNPGDVTQVEYPLSTSEPFRLNK